MAESSPGSLRSSRKRALEIGTSSAGFQGSVAYDPQAGTPSQDAGGHYKDAAEAAKPTSGSSPASDTSKPFALGGR